MFLHEGFHKVKPDGDGIYDVAAAGSQQIDNSSVFCLDLFRGCAWFFQDVLVIKTAAEGDLAAIAFLKFSKVQIAAALERIDGIYSNLDQIIKQGFYPRSGEWRNCQ